MGKTGFFCLFTGYCVRGVTPRRQACCGGDATDAAETNGIYYSINSRMIKMLFPNSRYCRLFSDPNMDFGP
ncbi:MAG: hypothetical protein ACI406_13160, partial [Victivallis vadensis]